MRYQFRKTGKTLDDENVAGNDPGYMKIMEDSGISWWNMNPIYAAWQGSDGQGERQRER